MPDDTVRIGGAPVDAGATYRITLNSFLADGGDGFGVLRSGSNRALSCLDVDAFAQYLERQPAHPRAGYRSHQNGRWRPGRLVTAIALLPSCTK